MDKKIVASGLKTWRWVTAEHKLQLTVNWQQFCNFLQNLLKPHGWQSDEHTWHQVYFPLSSEQRVLKSPAPPSKHTHTPPAVKGDASRSRVQRIDWDSLVSGGCTALPQFHIVSHNDPWPLYLPECDPTLPQSCTALAWEPHESSTFSLNTHTHNQLLPSVWLLSSVFGFMLLLCFTAASTLPPLLRQSYPANASCPDSCVVLSPPTYYYSYQIWKGRRSDEHCNSYCI